MGVWRTKAWTTLLKFGTHQKIRTTMTVTRSNIKMFKIQNGGRNVITRLPMDFIKIGSRVRPPDAHNCWMYNAPLLSNGHCHGNRIMGNMDATTQVSSKSLHWYASYSVSNILQYGGRPPSWIRILLFLTTHEVNNAVQLPCQNLVSIWSLPWKILWFYDFGWKMPNHNTIQYK